MVLLVSERDSAVELSVFNVDDLERVTGLSLLKVDEVDVRERLGVNRSVDEAYESLELKRFIVGVVGEDNVEVSGWKPNVSLSVLMVANRETVGKRLAELL
jgi:hypothetical protein